MKILIQIVLIALIATGAYFGRLYLLENGPVVPPKEEVAFVPTVEVLPVVGERRGLFIRAEGMVTSPSRLDITPEISGRIVRVLPALQEGAFIKQGIELAAIDEADYTLALQAATANTKARIAALDLELENAKVAVEDWQAIHEGTPPPLVTRALQIAAARAAVEGAKVSEGQAQLALDRAVLRMPFDGRVVAKMVEFGQRVVPGATMLTIEKVDDLEVRLTIPHSELGFIDLDLAGHGAQKLELEVSAEIGGRLHTWRATGARTVPMLDSRNPVVTLIATLLGPSPGSPTMDISSLLPGLFVTAKIRGLENVPVTAIPRTALQVDGSFFSVDADSKLRRHQPEFFKYTNTEALIAGDFMDGKTLRLVTLVPTISVEGMDVLVEQPGS
ncbi:MAG: HlyD family efflux transporter periplasmic adaptor subunit [Planctomycetota bacterium]|nr:HlyD family efflux transporter periplasmic adaptor subunit [Planctomycetota bacterium]MDG2144368.1 HlyD family efflux transporter periplasmic adaptor subunit [Planctomycetota bacterium]